jgi:hypothetical protein
MGNTFSNKFVDPVNYDCPVCKKTGELPNIAGRFFLINEKECQCNGCGSIFPKEQFYKTVTNDAINKS